MKQKIIVLIKFIIVVSICYALLAFNVFNIGEKLIPSAKDYVNMDIPQANQDLEQTYLETSITPQAQTGHSAANDIANLQSLCNSITYCDKIQFKGTFTDMEKYNYTKIFSRVIQFIHDNSTESQQIEDVISSIEINRENGNRRGYATHDSIIFNIGSVTSNKEFINLATHEMGHITDLGYIQGISSRKDKNYTEFGRAVFGIDDLSIGYYKLSRDKETIRKSDAKKKDFCSGYGMSDPFEDFAECFNLYTNHNNFFKQIGKSNIVLKKKYNLIASIFNGQYIGSNTQDLLLVKNDVTRRPRDTTKISAN